LLNQHHRNRAALYRQVRKGACYERSLRTFKSRQAKASRRPTKTGLMLGLGEEKKSEVLAHDATKTRRPRHRHPGRSDNTYQTTRAHLTIVRYVQPEESRHTQCRRAPGFQTRRIRPDGSLSSTHSDRTNAPSNKRSVRKKREP